MSHAGRASCESCGANITMTGSRLCPICDPDMELIFKGAPSKTPKLCDRCFEIHVNSHRRPPVPLPVGIAAMVGVLLILWVLLRH